MANTTYTEKEIIQSLDKYATKHQPNEFKLFVEYVGDVKDADYVMTKIDLFGRSYKKYFFTHILIYALISNEMITDLRYENFPGSGFSEEYVSALSDTAFGEELFEMIPSISCMDWIAHKIIEAKMYDSFGNVYRIEIDKEKAVEKIVEVAQRSNNMEYDLESVCREILDYIVVK